MARTILPDSTHAARILSDAKCMLVKLWKDDETALDGDIYDISDIVADTIAIEQDDNNVSSIESEFTDVPLFENVDLGKYNFGATCIDTQNPILSTIYGWTIGTSTDTGAYAPTGYKRRYAAIVVGFDNAFVVCPKVRLDSKLVIGTLKTGSAESQIAGTLYNAYISDNQCPLAILPYEGEDKTNDAIAEEGEDIFATITASVTTSGGGGGGGGVG